nr:hypothetical protein [Tanacetum cinerariifolium]
MIVKVSRVLRWIPWVVYNDLYLGRKALVERKNTGFDLTKSILCPSFIKDLTAKSVGLRVADSHTGNHLEDDFTLLEIIRRFLDVIGIRSLSTSKGRPSSRKGGLNLFSCAKLTTFAIMCKAYGCEPSFKLLRGFFNLFPGGKWLTFAKRPKNTFPIFYLKLLLESKVGKVDSSSFKIPLSLLVVSSFFPKIIEPTVQLVENTTDSGDSPRQENLVIHSEGVAARIRDQKCRTRGSSKPHVKSRLTQAGSTSRATRQKTSSKDESLLPDVLELQDANACHLKIFFITPLAWWGHLDNQLDIELHDLHDHYYARQGVVDNVVNRRARELLKVVEQIKGECKMLTEREKARDKECEELKAICEATMVDFDNNPVVKVLHEKIAAFLVEVKERKASLDRMLLESKKWAGYQVSLSTLESKVASLEDKNAKLEATKVSFHQEVENVKLDRAEVVSMVVLYVAMELVQSDDIGKLVTKLVSSVIFFGRCHAFEEDANVKENFDLTKVKGYRPSYKQSIPRLETTLRLSSALTRTHVRASSAPSQKATPSSALMSKLLFPSRRSLMVKTYSCWDYSLRATSQCERSFILAILWQGEKDCVIFNPLQNSMKIPSLNCLSSFELIVCGTSNLHRTCSYANFFACLSFVVGSQDVDSLMAKWPCATNGYCIVARWIPTGRIFNIIGLRWVPTGKMFADSTTTVDNKPLNGLVPQPPSLTPNVPPTKNDWDTLLCPMFDEYFNTSPSVAQPVLVVIVQEPVVLTSNLHQ